MSAKKTFKFPELERTFMFDVHTVTRQELIDIIARWGTDNGGRYIAGLLMQIAELRGFAPIELLDVSPNRTHFYNVRAYDTKEDGWNGALKPSMSTRMIDYMDVHGQKKFVFLHWYGRCPDPEQVAKKVKEIGARSIGTC